MDYTLKRHDKFKGARGPVVLVVLDGVGIGSGDEADAVKLARTPTFDRLWTPGARATLRAHGRSVGLPSDDDMGNSEVGHNALGAGRVYDQGALRVDRAIASGEIFDGKTWKELTERAAAGGAFHFIGLLSDGNVHSHIKHLFALLRRAAKDGARHIYVHALLDGRDVAAESAHIYLDQLEEVLAELREGGVDARVASGGGRMVITMDRYEAEWDMVARGWAHHVHGEGRRFDSALAAVQTLRGENPGTGDQYLPPFIVAPAGEEPVVMHDGDAVCLFNFRGDRAIEISRAFDDDELTAFHRGQRPDVLFAGIMEYDGDTHVPKRYLVEPPEIDDTMGEFLVANKVTQLAIAETQKYGHVTYFWNGNRSGKFDDASETYIEVGSDAVPFDQRPWMKAAEITDRLIAELRTGKYRFARVNYANGDMVGHTGSLDATVVAIEVLDLQLARLAAVVSELDGILVVTADHGNADEMFQHDKQGRVIRDSDTGQAVVKTSHTLNPVPLLVFDPNRRDQYVVQAPAEAGIANVTATCLELLGFVPPSDLEPSVLVFK